MLDGVSNAKTHHELTWLDRIDVAGWLLLLVGLTIAAIVVAMPAWLDVLDLRAQHATLKSQADLIDRQCEDHRAFRESLSQNDPVLLRRLAWHHLALKPGNVLALDSTPEQAQQLSADQWRHPASMLSRPPAIPHPIPRSAHAQTRLARLVTGSSRPWVMALGLWLTFCGLFLRPGSSEA